MEKIPFGKFGFIRKEPMEWMKAHFKEMISAGVVIVIGVVSVFYWLHRDSEKDYLAADSAFARWDGKQAGAFAELQRLLKKHPQLHAKYDGAIAQKLLASSEKGLAAGFGRGALKRIGDLSPYHREFSTCSLLIGEEQLVEALRRSKELKIAMEKDSAFWEQKSELARSGSILYVYNLVRIAMLEKAAGTAAGELAAWQELKKNAGWEQEMLTSKMYDPEAYQRVEENFRTEEISLQDYIRFREDLVISEKAP